MSAEVKRISESQWRLKSNQGENQLDKMKSTGTALDDIKIHVKVKESALWVSVMFCYI